ncbi:MAG: YkgJ family cysteine cluster protein [Candidatus Aenigmarchaeota archaeon]|nr:YkgJ family cysteine cluster protein [Candidatus Aenigmarchaeota archaeon]
MKFNFCEDCNKKCCLEAAPRISKAERDEIVRIAGRDLFSNVSGFFVPKTRDGFCAYFEKGRCSIHDHKPAECSFYPIYVMVDHDDMVFLTLDTYCPNIEKIPPETLAKYVFIAAEWMNKVDFVMFRGIKGRKDIPLEDFLKRKGKEYTENFTKELEKLTGGSGEWSERNRIRLHGTIMP